MAKEIDYKKRSGILTAVVVVLAAGLVLETLFVVWLYDIGTEMEEQEYECSAICHDSGAMAYYYDPYDELCSCADKEGEITDTYWLG